MDEARLFVEAPVWENVYFFSELDLATHELNDTALRYAQVYLDFENVSQLWGRDRMLNLRVGRFEVPFGEEYQVRYAIDNPLISHSLSDIWGEDKASSCTARWGGCHTSWRFRTAAHPLDGISTGDKSVAGRVGYDPADWLHLSVSGMRTGHLNAQGDMLSAVWFGGGWIEALPTGSASVFQANLVEGDVQARLPWLWQRTAGGYLHYGDNAPGGDTHRDVYYYYVEGTHDFTSKIYAAARFSQIFANNGFPIVGNGMMSEYFFSPELTSDYWRLSLGLGYRFGRNLVVKGEYSFNRGHELDGTVRDHEDLFALEAAFQF